MPKEKGGPGAVAVKLVALSGDGRFVFTNSHQQTTPNSGLGGYHNANDVWDARSGRLLHRLVDTDAVWPPRCVLSGWTGALPGRANVQWPAAEAVRRAHSLGFRPPGCSVAGSADHPRCHGETS